MKMTQLKSRVYPSKRQFTTEDQPEAQKSKLKYDFDPLDQAMKSWRILVD
jgi:hypothetical protein